MPEVRLVDPALAHLVVTADDGEWAARALAEDAARHGLCVLTHPVKGELRWVVVQPGAVMLRTTGLAAEELEPA